MIIYIAQKLAYQKFHFEQRMLVLHLIVMLFPIVLMEFAEFQYRFELAMTNTRYKP